MKVVWLIGLVAVTALLQVSFLPGLRPLGIVPNLALIVTVYAAVELAASEAMAVAAGLGVLLDAVSAVDFGLRTAFLCFIALLVIIIRRTGADFTRLSMLVAAIASAGILWNAAVLASILLAHDTVQWNRIILLVGYETGINCALVLLLHVPFSGLLQAITGRQAVTVIRG